MAQAPSLIFISGGVRSGKSSFAEKTAAKIATATGGNLHYIATGVPFDAEMKRRIEKHRHDRESAKSLWTTIEQPINLWELKGHFHSNDIVLLDCVTTLLNNELYSANHPWDDDFLTLVQQKVITGILAIKVQACSLIVVSNEVLNEPMPANKLVITYKKLLGSIHQQLVKEADIAYLVEAGVPIMMKEVI